MKHETLFYKVYNTRNSMRSLSSVTYISLISISICLFVGFFVLITHSTGEIKSTAAKLRGHSLLYQMASTTTPAVTIRRVAKIPPMLYGTAWKKDRTKELVELAIRTGFRGIDTACQPKHYYEPGVGEALTALINENVITRSDLFLQTKFTGIRGQDPSNIPYDPSDPIREQVWTSFSTSLMNLNTDYIDSLVMHSPCEKLSDTLIVWNTFEEIYDTGRVLNLGLSNTYDINTLRTVYGSARIKPKFLQNRFYKESGYDKEIREFCKQNGILYQTFWTLTANPHITKR